MAQTQHRTSTVNSVNQTLYGFFERSIDYAARIDPSYKRLWETLYKLIRSGGKRLRPRMTMLAYEAFGGKDVEKMIPIAAAQELLHFSLLVHDDIIDRDYTRYGTANVAGVYKNVYAEYAKTPDDLVHFSHSAALLGGDLMISGAHQMIASSMLSDKDKIIAQGFLAHSIFEVAGGELLDTELSFMPYREGDALKVARYKTAGYSFVAPLLAGATLAGINEKQREALYEYALSLGVAFQLVDDLLGVFGDEAKTGKSTLSDIREGKMTYMVERALAAMSDDEKKEFEQWFGNRDATDAGVAAVYNLLESTGAKQATIDLANEYAETARKAIADMQISAEYVNEFEKLVAKVTERSH
ncbi:MAG: polyprenyl synthetase family protein [Candidatus Nomurabacteria bacterium]|nr:MAG: polyprenyl synthetase family protein [Candidatus Nomurabacteria bacterium]